MSYEDAISFVQEQAGTIRLEDFCKTYTRHGGVKEITKAQFFRALDDAGVKCVTEAMVDAIDR